MDQPVTPGMTSHRPYLLRALAEWIEDNGMTPHLLVNAQVEGVHVPASAVKDGRVVLNIAERAVHQLSLGNEYITFNARFGGVSHEVMVPVASVMAIYARETGAGMALPDDLPGARTDSDLPTSSPTSPSLSSVPTQESDAAPSTPDEEPDPTPSSPTPRKGGHLRVVK